MLFFALLLLVGAAGAVLLLEDQRWARRQEQSESFQHLVGGLGFGPAVDLSGCAFCFDPRLDGTCSQECGPVPGGSCYCPRHGLSLLTYPPIHRSLAGQ
jgi:hypothetical protein